MSENKAHFLALIGQPPGGKGRNTKYDPDLHCQMVMDLAQAGEFQEAWASEIGITITTMRDWVRKHEEFREAVIIAHQLLVTFWTRKVAQNVTVKRAADGSTTEQAIPGMFNILMKRFPAIYGKSPIDLQAWLMEAQNVDGAAPEALTAETVKATSTDELHARLEALRRRRTEEQG
jgi:transposase-like protein